MIRDTSVISLVKVWCYNLAKYYHQGTLGKMYTLSRCAISHSPCLGIYNYLHKNANKKEGGGERGKQKFLLEIARDREPDDHCGWLQKLKNPGAGKLTSSSHREMVKAQVQYLIGKKKRQSSFQAEIWETPTNTFQITAQS